MNSLQQASILFLPILIGISACNKTNSDLVDKGKPGNSADVISSPLSQEVADPKLNVLFVVDNSGSMKDYQEKLAKNVRLFAEYFFANSRIDYRIGIVPIYDSKYLNDKKVYPKSGIRKMNPLGELVPLKGLSPMDKGNSLYITRETLNPAEVLSQTVMIGVQWGPEAEESFSPVLAVIDETHNKEKNQNFYQKDAFLAVVFLTDADDATFNLSGEDFYNLLVKEKGDPSKVLIAAAIPDIHKPKSVCLRDGDGPTQSFPTMLAASGGIFANLCSENFGAHLAEFGKLLTTAVSAQRISLGFTPDLESITVRYGPAKTPFEEREKVVPGKDGYYFDPDTNTIVLSPTMKVTRRGDSSIYVKATPANLGNFKNGKLKTIN